MGKVWMAIVLLAVSIGVLFGLRTCGQGGAAQNIFGGGLPDLGGIKGYPASDVLYYGGECILNTEHLDKAASTPLKTYHNVSLLLFQAKGKTDATRPWYALLFGPYPSSAGPAVLERETNEVAVPTRPYWMNLTTDGYAIVAGKLPIISARRVRAASDGTTFAVESTATFDRVYLLFDPNQTGVDLVRTNTKPETKYKLNTVRSYIEVPHDKIAPVSAEIVASSGPAKDFLDFAFDKFKAAPFTWP